MANQLMGMNIKQVHLTGSPAVRKKYLIVKSEEAMAKNPMDDAEDQKDKGADEDSEDANGNKKKKVVAKSTEELEKTATDALEAKTTAETALKAKDAALIKSALEILKSVESETAKGAVETLETELGEKKVEKSDKTTASEVETIVKSLMPELVKGIEEPIKKALSETRSELEEVKKSNAALVGERTERELEEISKSLVGDREKNIEYLRLMKSKLDEEEFKQVVTREQEKAETVRKSGVFGEIGTTTQSKEGADTPYQQLMEIANGMVQKSSDLTADAAFVKAVRERPDLYDAYRQGSYVNNGVRED